MEQEHRGKMDPVPDNVYQRLNADQLLALRLVENHGWHEIRTAAIKSEANLRDH